jgi:predicted membrane protein
MTYVTATFPSRTPYMIVIYEYARRLPYKGESSIMTQTYERRGGSPIWALILIAVGVIWLLGQAGILRGANFAVLLRLWPLLLIALGLEILVGRNSRTASTVIMLGALALLIALMLVGPAIGLAPNVEAKTAQFEEPVGDATAATINVDLGVGRGTVTSLSDSNQLITADMSYAGEVEFNASGEAEKVVTLSFRNDEPVLNLDFLGLTFNQDETELYTNVSLSPNVPLDLDVNAGVGENTLDLAGLQLERLRVNSGVGKLTLTLPPTSEVIDVSINSGVGETFINVSEGAIFDADIHGGLGQTTIDLPEGAAIRLEATTGLGDIEVPGGFERIDSGNDDDRSIWQTANYEDTTNRITIAYQGGIGQLLVH